MPGCHTDTSSSLCSWCPRHPVLGKGLCGTEGASAPACQSWDRLAVSRARPALLQLPVSSPRKQRVSENVIYAAAPQLAAHTGGTCSWAPAGHLSCSHSSPALSGGHRGDSVPGMALGRPEAAGTGLQPAARVTRTALKLRGMARTTPQASSSEHCVRHEALGSRIKPGLTAGFAL